VGAHAITAKAYDAAGNVGTSSTVDVTAFIDVPLEVAPRLFLGVLDHDRREGQQPNGASQLLGPILGTPRRTFQGFPVRTALKGKVGTLQREIQPCRRGSGGHDHRPGRLNRLGL